MVRVKWRGPMECTAFPMCFKDVQTIIEQNKHLQKANGQAVIAEAFKNNLDATNDEQRMTATHQLLGKVSRTGTTGYMSEFVPLG